MRGEVETEEERRGGRGQGVQGTARRTFKYEQEEAERRREGGERGKRMEKKKRTKGGVEEGDGRMVMKIQEAEGAIKQKKGGKM